MIGRAADRGAALSSEDIMHITKLMPVRDNPPRSKDHKTIILPTAGTFENPYTAAQHGAETLMRMCIKRKPMEILKQILIICFSFCFSFSVFAEERV